MSKKVQLILRSADISNLGYTGNNPVERTQAYNGQNGSINIRQSNMTWNNINLRSVLGSLYKDGGTYNLRLVSVVFGLTSNVSTYSSVENDKNFNIYISGLPFIKSYCSTGALNNEALLTTVRVPHGAQAFIFNYNNNVLSFQLSQNIGVENISINIEFRDFLTDLNEPSATMTVGYPHSQYVFEISEVEK
jgi:hypothetical protein